MKRIFLICPVRNITEEVKTKISVYVSNLEIKMLDVYWPQRDTVQEGDPIGTRICTDNRKAIESANEVHIWWTTTSTGTMFDLGIAWALRKPLVIANPDEVQPTKGKSFQNVILEWSK